MPMNIQITTNSGQKFVMKGEELIENVRLNAIDAGLTGEDAGLAAAALKDFLATYEKEPATDV